MVTGRAARDCSEALLIRKFCFTSGSTRALVAAGAHGTLDGPKSQDDAARLYEARLQGAYLRDADLRCANLRGADLSDAVVKGVKWQFANLLGLKPSNIREEAIS